MLSLRCTGALSNEPGHCHMRFFITVQYCAILRDLGSGDLGSRDSGSRDLGSRDTGSRVLWSRDSGTRDLIGSWESGSRDQGGGNLCRNPENQHFRKIDVGTIQISCGPPGGPNKPSGKQKIKLWTPYDTPQNTKGPPQEAPKAVLR